MQHSPTFVHVCVALIVLAAVVATGCSKHPPTIRATGAVEYHGQPVAGAVVTFFSHEGRAASGTTDDHGRFQLTSFDPNDGAALGNHTVTITKWVKVSSDKIRGATEIRKMGSTLNPGEVVIIANFLPKRYGDVQLTPLSAVVSAGDKNDFIFELAD